MRAGAVLAVVMMASVSAGAQPAPAETGGQWHDALRQQLCDAYGASREATGASGCLEQVAREIGDRLATDGMRSVPAEDVAALALLMTQAAASPGVASPVTSEAPPLVAIESPERADAEALSDLPKGQEGFRQGVERLAELPLSERMVVTGDVTSGFQAATVEGAPDLTAAFGRARVNFVTRAVSASDDGVWDEGYFFVQMIAAGGPFDASQVGGPATLTPLNDVATDRSLFNQGSSRGNLYMKKAFYEQGLDLGRQGTVLGRVGVISLSDLFDTSEFANNEARQFLNGAFVNSPGYKGGLGAPGFMAEYRREADIFLVDTVTVRTGYAVTRSARALTSPVWTNEIEVRTTVGGRPGTYRIGGTVGNVPETGAMQGLHLGFDQWLTDSIGLFGRYAQSSRGPGSVALGPVHRSYSAGTQWRFEADGREVSAWGLAFSQAFPIELDQPLVSERVLEAYYRRQFSENLSLTPDVQLVSGAGGRETQGMHLVGSLRMTVGF